MKALLFSVGLILPVLTGCGSSPPPGIADAGADASQPMSLSQCVPGWWLNAATTTCQPCPSGQPPECASSDCVLTTFYGFLADGSGYEGSIAWSAQARTTSSVGSAVRVMYTLGDGTITLTPPGTSPTKITCSGGSLSIALADHARAPADLAQSLANATSPDAGLSWRGLQY